MNETLKLIKRIEFHERKSRNLIMAHIETQFHVSDLEKFIALCCGEEWTKTFGGLSDFTYKMKQMQKSRAKRPKFRMYVNHKDVVVYPKENMVAVVECGLHYICQHSFDIIPHPEKDVFYGHKHNKGRIGKLFAMDGRKLDVYNTDILDGFMLHREQINGWDDSLVEWVQHCRDEDERCPAEHCCQCSKSETCGVVRP